MEPLLVLNHIPKTGGTALRQVARANYRPDEFAVVGRAAVEMQGARGNPSEAERRARDFYVSLPPERRARLRCVASHAASLMIPGVTDRPVRAFSMLRDPVDYVISSYLFLMARAERLEAGAQVPLAGLITDALRERRWGLKEIYRELGGTPEPDSHLHALFGQLFNGQARHLLLGQQEWTDIPFTTEANSLERHRDRAFRLLEGTYVVGALDRFSESIRLFADSFGWRLVFVPRANVGSLRGGQQEAEIDEETRDLIRSHNRIDAELHAHYSRRLDGRPRVGRLTDLEGKVRRRGHRYASKLRRGTRRGAGNLARRTRRLRT